MKNKVNRGLMAKKTKLFSLCLALMCATQLFAYDCEIDGICYKLNHTDNTAEIEQYFGFDGIIFIPSAFPYNNQIYTVTSIGASAFSSLSSSSFDSKIVAVTIPESVIKIGAGAFAGCKGLINIPSSITIIEDWAFKNCTYFTSITIPDSLKTVGVGVFSGCSNLTSITWNAKNCENIVYSYNYLPFYDIASQITNFTFGDKVETIPSGLCYGMSQLTSITIPDSLKTMGDGVFSGCSNLTSITWNAKNCEHLSYNSPFSDIASQITNFTFGDKVETIPSYLCRGMSQLTSITIPNSVTTIGSSAFFGCSGLTSITWNAINNGEDDYYSYSSPFSDIASQITNFTFGDKVETIPSYLCYRMSQLTSITIPNSVTTIGSSAFSNCSGLTSVHITDLAAWCKIHFGEYDGYWGNPLSNAPILYLNNQPLTDIVIPNTIDSIQPGAFVNYQGLASLTVPSSVKYIGESAFYACTNLSVLNLNEGLQNIDREAFYGTAISSIRLPQSVRYVDLGAFADCKQVHKVEILGDITWREFETEEDEEDFYLGMQYDLNYNPLSYASWYYLSAFPLLDTIIAPAGCFDLPEVAWSAGTKSLKYVKVNSGELSENALQYINRSYKTLKSLDVSFVSNIEFADEAFKGYYNLETLLLPADLQRISYMMVADCKNLKSIDIPASVEEIDQSAFEDCRSLQTITFGGAASAPSRNVTNATSQLKKIGNWAFYNAHELQHLDIPEGVEEIGDAAFYGCTYLEDLALPASMRTIGDNCFALCSKLKRITSSAIVPPAVCARTFYDVNRQIPVYVPNESVTAYNTDMYWQEFNIQGGAATDLETMHGSQFTNSPVHQFTKYIHNGRLLIEHNGNLYNAHGARVK